MRYFVSIEFPEHIRSEILHSFEKLKNSGTCSGNFVEKENLHLTLSFLGELSDGELDKVKKILSKVDYQKFPLEIDKIGFFPNIDYIKVMWVGIKSGGILPLKKQIEDSLRSSGFSVKETDFVPHLTVARINSVKDKSRFTDIFSSIKIEKSMFIAEDFALMKSILKKTGPEYKILERYGMRIRS